MAGPTAQFMLVFHSSDGEEQVYELSPQEREKLVVGSTSGADVRFEGEGLVEYHALFRLKKDVVTMHMLGPTESAHIGQFPLLKGKIYILEPNDHILMGGLKIQLVQKDLPNNNDSDAKLFEDEPTKERVGLTEDDLLNEEENEDEDETKAQDQLKDEKTEDVSLKELFDVAPEIPDQEIPSDEDEDFGEEEESGLMAQQTQDDDQEEDDEEIEVVDMTGDNDEDDERNLEIEQLEDQDEEGDFDDDDDYEEEEEEEEEDDDEEEDQKDNITVSRLLKGLFKKGQSEKKESPLKKHPPQDIKRSQRSPNLPGNKKVTNNARSAGGPIAGIFSRLLATLLDITFFFVLWNSIFELLELNSLLLKTVKPLSAIFYETSEKILLQIPFQSIPTVGPLMADLIDTAHSLHGVAIFTIFLILQATMALITGVTFGGLVMGMTNRGGFLPKRFKGVIRTLSAPITFPLIIPELPLVFGRRTMREMVLADRVIYRTGWLRAIALPIIFPTFLVAFFCLPLGIEYLLNPPKQEVSLSIQEQKPPLQFQQVITSSQLGLTMKIEEENELIRNSYLLPVIPEKHEMRSYRASHRHQVDIYSYDHADPIRLTANHQFVSFQSLVERMLAHNPLARLRYPELRVFMDHYQMNNQASDRANTQDKLTINSISEREFLRALNAAINYHSKDFDKVLRHHGPFIKGPLNSYDQLLNIINQPTPLDLTWYSRESSNARVWLPPWMRVNSRELGASMKYYFEMSGPQWSNYRIEFNRETRPLAEYWERLLLRSLPVRHAHSQLAIQEATKSENLSFAHFQPALELGDLIHQVLSNTDEIEQPINESVVEPIEDYYRSLAREALGRILTSENEEYKIRLLDHLSELDNFCHYFLNEYEDSAENYHEVVEQLQTSISPIIEALKEEDIEALQPPPPADFIDEPFAF